MNTIRLKHRLAGGGGAGSPTGTAVSGEVAINFDVVSGAPEFWARNATTWQLINPTPTISTQSINLGPTGADVGAGYAAWAVNPANKITGNVVIATWGTPAQAYVLTNAAAPNLAISWTSLGGAVSFATAADIHAATNTTKAINSAILRGETVTVSAGITDADKLVRLNTDGVLDASLLSVSPIDFKGAKNVTVAIAGGPYVSGDMIFANAAGTVDASWTGAAGATIASGDSLIYDGTNWHIVPNKTDLSSYLALSGGTMEDGAKVTFDVTTGGVGTVVLDLATGGIDNAVINCGTF